MKVILVGLPQTDVCTLVVALRKLNMTVYDVMDHFAHLEHEWKTIGKYGGTTEDFHKMYRSVDAIAGFPIWYFWEEIHKAFPDAKIILTVRDSEEDWYRSLVTEKETYVSHTLLSLPWFSPTYWKFYDYVKKLGSLSCFGIVNLFMAKKHHLNELLLKKIYRHQYIFVKETAPKSQFMIYNVRHGWGPLCKFLGVDVPSIPFPFDEVCGKLQEELLLESPVFARIQQEVKITIALICLTFGFFAYHLVIFEPEPPLPHKPLETDPCSIFEAVCKPLYDYFVLSISF